MIGSSSSALQIESISSGNYFDVPAGFNFLSISPDSGATWTSTNPNDITSDPIADIFTFPSPPTLSGWGTHRITAIGGTVLIAFY